MATGRGAEKSTSAHFVKGGVVGAGMTEERNETAHDEKHGSDDVAAQGTLPAPPPPPQEAAEIQPQLQTLADASRTGKRKHIDTLLDQMRSEHAPSASADTADALQPSSIRRKGSKETADAYTTNLSIGNLSPSADEEVLKRTFAAYGPIASVKIMWPRGEDANSRRPLRAFVAFMSRRSAEDAMREMQGRVIYGLEIKLDWGKAITLPSQPVWPPPEGEEEPIQLTIPKPANATPMPAAPSMDEPHPHLPDIKVEPPKDPRRRHEIDTLAAYIAQDGVALEEEVKKREQDNSRFKFLFSDNSAEHVYYRWRVFSYAQGDSDTKWRTEPFQMCVNGARWIPPMLDEADEQGNERNSKTSLIAGAPKASRRLTQEEAYAWKVVLRNISTERSHIAEAMLFALSKPESAEEIVTMLAESVTNPEATASSKIARLLVASDILYNAGADARKSRAYQTLLQGRLPQMMAGLNHSLLRSEGRITMEGLKLRVLSILRMWSEWLIFSEDFLIGLEVTFLRGAQTSLGSHLSAQATTQLRNDLNENDERQLALHCKHSGLDARGTKEQLIARLLLHEDRRQERQLPTAPSKSL